MEKLETEEKAAEQTEDSKNAKKSRKQDEVFICTVDIDRGLISLYNRVAFLEKQGKGPDKDSTCHSVCVKCDIGGSGTFWNVPQL